MLTSIYSRFYNLFGNSDAGKLPLKIAKPGEQIRFHHITATIQPLRRHLRDQMLSYCVRKNIVQQDLQRQNDKMAQSS